MGRLQRIVGLGTLVGNTASSLISDRVRPLLGGSARSTGQAARDLAESLSKLKGVAMKAGQQLALLSVHLDLPEEVQQALGILHAKADPVPFPAIRQAVELSLQARIEDRFERFDTEPLGTASLAQAHAARLPGGREVVVKVLHDGVAEAVDADLIALRSLLRFGKLVTVRDPEEIEDIIGEIETRLREELDYLQEAANIEAFRLALGQDPRFVIPSHVPELSNERILVLDRVYGAPIDEFVAGADRALRQRAGENLAELFFTATFHRGLLHADPHPGNYLFLPDGRIGLLDFGCVKRFEPHFLARYAETVLAALMLDRKATLDGCVDLGVWDGLDQAAGDAIWDFCDAIVHPWRKGETTIGPGEEDLVLRVKPAAERLWRFSNVRGAKDMLFLHRSLGGMYALARKLEVRADWGSYLRRHLGVAIERGKL